MKTEETEKTAGPEKMWLEDRFFSILFWLVL